MGQTVKGQPLESQLEIRRVGFGHADALRLVEEVQAVYVERYGGPDDTPLEPAMFDPPGGSFFVGYVDGRAVATGAWRRRDDLDVLGTRQSAEIKRMYVADGHRGAGHARRMLAHLEQTAARAGAEALVLETGIRQPEAIALYASSGYVEIDKFGYYADSPISRCFGKALALEQALGSGEATGSLTG